MRLLKSFLALVVAVLSLAGGAAAAQYPERTVRIVVPYPPGGTSDVLARILADRLSQAFKRSFIVENRPGGSGIIGVQAVANADPDGYTLLLANSGTHGINSALFKSLPYDPVNDFTPITVIGSPPNVLLANPNSAARTLQDVLDAARANPGGLNFGTTSMGGSPHMSGELLKVKEAVDIALVVYNGAGPMLTDLIGGHIEFGFDNLPSSIGHIQSGTVRPIAVTTLRRWPGLPDVPTFAESNIQDYDVAGWFGLFAPRAAPPEIIDTLYAAIRDILQDPDVVARFQQAGAEPGGIEPAAFRKKIIEEIEKWQGVVAASGMKVQ